MLLPRSHMVKNRSATVRHLARTTSTQDVVRRAALAGAPDGFCCQAEEQTAGRGRQGRSWVAPAGSALLASVLVRVAPPALAAIPFAAGLAVLDALETTCGLAAELKWPNDVLVGGRKLAGLLVELEPAAARDGLEAVIVGLGLNLTVERFPEGANGISLDAAVPTVPASGTLLDAWLQALLRWVRVLETDGAPTVLAAWRVRAAGLGAAVTVTTPGGRVEGVAEDVGEDGALLIRTAAGVVPVLAGDVHIVPGS